ncbi:MAG: response regulator transcription factor [Bacteroidetes bacterium]|nr:response regulator transcription factor [Bacteroidota bacterium]MBK8343734.1 response regulator transcription factor [Bacteroidota bacterium]
MIRAIIIDDESRARSALKQEIALNCPEVLIVGEADSVQSSVELIQSVSPELIFLDIQLSDGLGFHILDVVGNEDYEIIFTTAYSEYAIKAFKTNALDYLLKPIDSEELIAAVAKVSQKKEDVPPVVEPNAAVPDLTTLQQKKIILHTSDGLFVIQVADIIRCNSYGNYSFVYLKDGNKILLAKILKEIEESLRPFGFERVHHSHLINLNHVKSFRHKDGGLVIMSDLSEVPVSLRKKSAFLEQLEKLNNV